MILLASVDTKFWALDLLRRIKFANPISAPVYGTTSQLDLVCTTYHLYEGKGVLKICYLYSGNCCCESLVQLSMHQ